ncbi:hypothetical protein PHISP_02880 [Aspergillus sp. HF37]|nr:hypothetical protein PHISP_02880 [Aspergillus sp. HF37]
MPRRAPAPRDYHDVSPHDSDDRDRPPRRSRRERITEDDGGYYPRRKPRPPLDEFERLHIRDRSAPDFPRDDISPRRHRRRLSPTRRIPREVERDEREFSERGRDRRRYVERESDEEDQPVRKGRWAATPGGFGSDEESPGRDKRRARRRDARSPSESDYGREERHPRRSRRDELDTEYGMGREEFQDRSFSRSPPRPRYRGDDDEGVRMQSGARGRRGRTRRLDRDDDLSIRKHRRSPPPRFADSRERYGPWSQDEWTRSGDSDDGYGSPQPPRVPSPELRFPRDSLDGLEPRHRGARRPRPSNEDILDEWQDRRSSPSSTCRFSPESDDWREHEDIPRFRERSRSPDRDEAAFASEWGGMRRSKDVRDEFEEDPYRRPSTGKLSSNDSVAGDWAMVDPPRRSRRPMRDEHYGPEREIMRGRHSRERRPRFPSGDRRRSEDDTDRGGQIGRRYVGAKERRERLWTEITKDLVVREAIERAGYEFEETDLFYYIFEYLQYVCPSFTLCIQTELTAGRTMFLPLSTFQMTSAGHAVDASMRFTASGIHWLVPLHWSLREEDRPHQCYHEDRLLAAGLGRDPWRES